MPKCGRMKAIILKEIHKPLVLEEVPEPAPAEGERIVKLHAAALNRRDYWITVGQYPAINPPVIPGSDGTGMSEGEMVLINPGLYWGNNQAVQSGDFEVLGLPRNGTFAEYISVPEEYIHPKPVHLNWAESAALPLAGVTAYRSLIVQGKAEPKQRVLITGIGGGVAMMVMLMALAHEMEVFVTSSDEEKLKAALALGAMGAANYKNEGWEKSILPKGEHFDLIIDSAGGKPFANLLKLCKPGGRIVVYGGTLGKVDGISLQVLFWRQQHIIGSTMGSQKDFKDMLDFVIHHKIRPIIDRIYPLEDINEAIARMGGSDHFGKVVISIRD